MSDEVISPPLEKVWQFQADSNIIRPGLLTAAYNQIYFASNEGNIFALDAATGQVKWAFKMGKALEIPLITAADGLIFAASKDKKLYAINAQTGIVQWQFSTNKEFVYWFGYWGYLCFGLAIADGTIYVATKNKNLYALDTQTGRVQWQFQANGEIHSPAISNKTMFFGSTDKKVYALNAKSGQKLWETKIDNEKQSRPLIAYNKLLIAVKDDLFALDPNNGTTLWKAKNVLSYSGLPVIANGFAFCTKELSVIDLGNGKEIEKMTYTPPVQSYQQYSVIGIGIVDGTLIAMIRVTWSGQTWYDVKQKQFISAYDIATRKEKWFDHSSDNWTPLPLWETAKPYIYVADDKDGKLVVLNTAEPSLKWESESIPHGFSENFGKPLIAYGMVLIGCGKTVHAFRSAAR